jgi:hypothetical protein
MKKLLAILVLGLLWSGNTHANHTKTLETVLSNPKCNGLKLRLTHYSYDKYIIFVQNPTKVSMKINFVKFLTKDDDIISTVYVKKFFPPFHKGSIEITRSQIMHEYVKKISIGCDT